MPNVPTPAPILCDSCGLPATPEHIRARMARLELATRHRPFHIGLLLVCTSPPANPADDIYAWEQQAGSEESRTYIESLFQCIGVSLEKNPSDQLADLQRHGVYIARLVECPLSENALIETLSATYGAVLAKRITYSYKPRQIGLLTPVAPGLDGQLRAAGFSDRLVGSGQGIETPAPHDSEGLARVRTMLGRAIAASEVT